METFIKFPWSMEWRWHELCCRWRYCLWESIQMLQTRVSVSKLHSPCWVMHAFFPQCKIFFKVMKKNVYVILALIVKLFLPVCLKTLLFFPIYHIDFTVSEPCKCQPLIQCCVIAPSSKVTQISPFFSSPDYLEKYISTWQTVKCRKLVLIWVHAYSYILFMYSDS